MTDSFNQNVSLEALPHPDGKAFDSKIRSLGSINHHTAKLSRDGLGFLVSTLDPNHDTPFVPVGMPDDRQAPSLLRAITQEVTLAAPTGVSGNWDAVVGSFPIYQFGNNTTVTATAAVPAGGAYWSNATYSANGGLTGGQMLNLTNCQGGTSFSSPTLTAAQPGLVCWAAGPAGTNFYPSPAGPLPTGTSAQCPANMYGGSFNGDQYLNQRHRLIAVCFEVHNTTAVNNLQGAVTVVRLPSRPDVVAGMSTGNAYPSTPAGTSAGAFPVAETFWCIPAPPPNASAAAAFPNSQVWEAMSGVYCVNTFTGSNEVVTPNGVRPVIVPSPLTQFGPNVAIATVANVLVPYLNQSTAAQTTYFNGSAWATTTLNRVGSAPPLSLNYSGWDQVHAYFTGLSASSTLTVQMRVIIQEFPEPLSPDITLAKPSPPYDPYVLEAYARLKHELPSGVKANCNADGSWWKMLKRGIDTAITSIAPKLSMAAPEMAPVINAVKDIAHDVLTDEEEQIYKMREREGMFSPPSHKYADKIDRVHAQRSKIAVANGQNFDLSGQHDATRRLRQAGVVRNVQLRPRPPQRPAVAKRPVAKLAKRAPRGRK